MVREAVRVWSTPLEAPFRITLSARANRSWRSLSPPSAAARTARTALRTVERTCLFPMRRLSDWRWRFSAER